MLLISGAYVLYALYGTYFVNSGVFECYYFEEGVRVLIDCVGVFFIFFFLINPLGWTAIVLMILGIRGLIKQSPSLNSVSPN